MNDFSTRDDLIIADLPKMDKGDIRPRSSWRARLAATLAVLCILLLTVWQIWGNYREVISDLETLSTALARVSEEHITGLLRGVDVVLSEVVELVPEDGVPDPGAFNALLAKRMAQFSFIRNVFLTDSNGLVTSSTVAGIVGLDVRDREYFTALAADPSRHLFISPPLQSRVRNVVSIFLVRAVRTAGGKFLGIAVITIDPSLFEDALRSVVPVAGGRVALIRDDGIILARQPDPQMWRGKSVVDGEIFRAVSSGRSSGILLGRGKSDGAERVASYRKFETYPLIVAVGIATQPALAHWRSESAAHAGVVFVLAVVLIGLATMSDRLQAEQQLAQLALTASEARFRLLNERSPVGIVQARADGCCLYANERWLSLTGRRGDELLGRKWCEVIADEDRATVAEAWAGLARNGGDFLEEMRIQSPDGTIRWVRGHASALGGSGEAAGLVVTFEDITAAQEDKQKLTLSEEKFAKAFLGSPDALVISTMIDGSYVEVNTAFCRLLGYGRAEFIGTDAKTLRIWARPEDRERLVSAAILDGQVEGFETVLRRKDGNTLIGLISVQQIMVAGEPCLLFICRDISEQRAMEARTQTLLAKLDASNKELEQFAYVASHDLQEPLRMIAGYAQLIDRRYRGKLDSDADEFIAFLVDGAKRMQGMIQDLLEYSRVERLGGAFVEFDGAGALEDVRVNLSVAVGDTKANIHIGPMPMVTADRSQFVRLFQNLVGNALKYRHPDRVPVITVGSERQGDAWVFSVADNGIGIGPEYYGRIFQVFQRLHTRDQYPGSGIGLAICKKIVERHGGRIWVESEAGAGTVFYFTLPVSPELFTP